jgi:uncharacterized protein
VEERRILGVREKGEKGRGAFFRPECYNDFVLPRNLVSYPMFLYVKEMERKEVRFDQTLPPGQIDFSGQEVEQSSPLQASGSAELIDGSEEIRVEGRYSVEMTAECDRCLGRARFPLEGTFDLYYRPASELPHVGEIEVENADTEIGFYEGEGLELDDILREQVLLALPMQRVCGETCKGICPICGVNRNENECSCNVNPADDRWGSALKKLEL